MWDGMGGAEGELRHEETEGEGQEVGAEPGCSEQQQAALGPHDGGVVERKADGHVAVIGHHNQQEVIQQGQFHEEEHLHEAPSVGDGVVLCVDVDQQLGEDGAGEAGVSEGQVGQEEVHGGVEAGVRADGQDNEQVPQHGDQVHRQEEPGQESLLLWVLREAQEQEVRDAGFICNAHLKEKNARKILLQKLISFKAFVCFLCFFQRSHRCIGVSCWWACKHVQM